MQIPVRMATTMTVTTMMKMKTAFLSLCLTAIVFACCTTFAQVTVGGNAKIGGAVTMGASSGGGAIAFDAVSNATPITSGNTISWTHTGGSCSSGCVIFVCVAGDTDFAGTGTVTATYNGVTMTRIIAVEDGASVLGSDAFILPLGTSVGTHTVQVTSSGSAGTAVTGAATSWSGVNQTTPNRTVTNATGPGSASPITVTASNALSGDVVVDCMNVYGNSSTIASGTTPRYVVKNISSTAVSMGTSSAVATGSQVMNYTGTPDSYWNIGAVPLIP